jgi:flagellar biogenesis protein FliO
MVRQGQGGARQAAGMRVIGRLPLSMNQSVVLVAVGSEVLLLGVGQRVELLWRIENAEMKESVLREVSLPSGGVPLAGTLRGLQDSDFRGLLEDSLRRVREGRNLRRERGERDE